MKQLIVVSGYKRAGKDSFGDALVYSHGFKKAQPFAVFKIALAEWFDFSEEQCNGALKEVVDPRWGLSFRQLTQEFGSGVMKDDLGKRLPLYAKTVGRRLWALVFRNWYLRQPDGLYVVCDWRFPEEQEALLDIPNVVFVRIENNRLKKNKDMHCSEEFANSMPVHYKVLNNGTLLDLENTTYKLMQNVNATFHMIPEINKEETYGK